MTGARAASIGLVALFAACSTGDTEVGVRTTGDAADRRTGGGGPPLTSGAPAATTGSGDSASLAERRREVAQRGALVMPFDLERTTHVFEPRDDGGVQHVLADDPADTLQVRLAREHLREEARRFAGGDFGDPASIHGADMPGLEPLRAGYAAVDVRYADVPGGARIRYHTADPALVEALHAWFAAQVSDHGEHAEHGARP